MSDTEKLKYPGMRADISRCNELLHELCQIVWDRSYRAEQVMFSIPPVPRNFDMQFSAAFDELSAYRAIGDVEELTALAKARDEGRVVVLPCAKNGAELYFADKYRSEIYREAYTDGVGLFWTNDSDIGDYIPLSCIGKTVFLTRAEAEAALGGAVNHE